MAVSHQWFIQRSSPSMLFADINRKYENVNQGWNYYDINRFNPLERKQLIPPVYREQNLVYNQLLARTRGDSVRQRNINLKDRNGTAAIMLWLTMMGFTQPQSMPADNETPPFSTLYKWKTIDFEFPSTQQRRKAILSK